MQVNAEAAEPCQPPRGVDTAGVPVEPLGVRGQHRQHHILDVLAVQHRPLGPDHPAVEPQRRRLTRQQEQVARAALRHGAQPEVEFRPGVGGSQTSGIELRNEPVEIVFGRHRRHQSQRPTRRQ